MNYFLTMISDKIIEKEFLMELVYLWVEKYKNIEKQGFNFSPRFRCEFKDEYDENKELKDNCKLIIEENKNSLESFFGTNLSITALVGKNGSGKTSLLTLLVGGIFQNIDNWREIKNLILIYNDRDSFYTYSFSNKEEEYKEMNFESNIEIKKYFLYKNNFFNDDMKFNYHIFMDFTIGQIDLWNDGNQENFKKYYALEPSRNYFSKGPGCISKIEPTSFAANMKANILYLYKYLDNEFIKKWKLPSFNKLVYYGIRRMGGPTRDYYKEEIIGKNILGMDFSNCIDYESVKNVITEFFKNNKEINFEDIKKEELKEISILFLFADIEFENDERMSFFSMSAGQKQLISYFGIIIRIINEQLNINKTLTLIIDEIETSLHPQWQKEFLKLLIELLSYVKDKSKNIQLILAGHSPFIVSDLPKENIIFLEDSMQVNGVEKKETFGANIHTLLSDSFFVEGGLIGEFAKSKIDLAIKYLNQKILTQKELNYCENIISIIGEPIIKRQLQKMIDSKRLQKIDEIDKIYDEIEFLKHRIEILRKNS